LEEVEDNELYRFPVNLDVDEVNAISFNLLEAPKPSASGDVSVTSINSTSSNPQSNTKSNTRVFIAVSVEEIDKFLLNQQNKNRHTNIHKFPTITGRDKNSGNHPLL